MAQRLIIKPLVFTGFCIAVESDKNNQYRLIANTDSGIIKERNSRIIHPIFQSLINYTSLQCWDASRGKILRYFKAGHFFIQRISGSNYWWFDITDIIVNRSSDDVFAGIKVVDFLMGYGNGRYKLVWGIGNDNTRAPWLDEEHIERIVKINKDGNVNDRAAILMKEMNEEIKKRTYPDRKKKSKIFMSYAKRTLEDQRKLDYYNLQTHHSGPDGQAEAKKKRMSTKHGEVHYRPALNASAGTDNRGIKYYPAYECTTIKYKDVPNSFTIAINE